MKYYLTYYEAYPIYEHAEGGYYYEGREAIKWAESDKLVELIDYMREMVNDLELKIIIDNNNQYEDLREILNQLDTWGAVMIAVEQSKYIGENRYLILEIESEFQGYESHWHPYE